MPNFLEEQLQRVINGRFLNEAKKQFSDGMNHFGLVEMVRTKRCLLHLFRKGSEREVSVNKQLSILKVQFSIVGSSTRQKEEQSHRTFISYIREVAAGRRGEVTLGRVLQFITGLETCP